MKFVRLPLLFLLLNFLALGIGVLLMNSGPTSNWYLSLNKAPWTPESWVFGTAWTLIMVFYAVYMAKLLLSFKKTNKTIIKLYGFQWFMNVVWNYLFFNQHLEVLALVDITLLLLLVGYFTFNYLRVVKLYTIFIIPYLIWMTIATSLNLYIVLNN